MYLSLLATNSVLTFEIPLDHPTRLAQAINLAMLIAGAALPSERAQMRIAVIAATFVVLVLAVALSGVVPITFE